MPGAPVLVTHHNSFRFGQDRRLMGARDFKRVFDNNNLRASNQQLLILALCDKAATVGKSSRVGIVVSKKHVRLSVDRNRIKRLIREYFRQHVAPVCSDTDFVVVIRQGIKDDGNQRINEGLRQQFEHISKKIKRAALPA